MTYKHYMNEYINGVYTCQLFLHRPIQNETIIEETCPVT